MNEIFKHKHQLWLSFLFASLSTDNAKIKDRLYEFSNIEFRHLKWIANYLYENHIEYDYGRDRDFNITFSTTNEMLDNLLLNISATQKLYNNSEIFNRIANDERYFTYEIENFKQQQLDAPLSAFNKSLKYYDANLDKKELDAFIIFLFEELYKEYELIMVYFYQQVRAKNTQELESFNDLIYESHFHLRSFGEMMAELGILALPRELHKKTYIIDDMKKFLADGIAEEEGAKEQCMALSSAIKDEQLSKFFDFINLQESYHITIMQKLLKGYENG